VSDFASAYEQHVWQVYGFFAYRLSSRADAEDLTQQTFERALRAWPRYDPRRAAPGTWFMAIARNLLIDHLRADRSTRQRPLDDEEGVHDERLAVTDRHNLGVAPDLERALGALSDREREILALRFGGDLTGADVAALTGLTLANVQQILSRALRRLRVALDESSAAEGRGERRRSATEQ
jgi:RNA polymerase sigma-70 factor (ECF subfamily)